MARKSKDLVIGGASGYTYNDLKPWVKSLKETGYDGDIVLCITNMENEEISKLAHDNVNILLFGKPDENGTYRHVSNAPHVDRFFYIWQYLDNAKDKYDRVVTTDTRDVIFQRNPFDDVYFPKEGIFTSSEGLRYKDEPWGWGNVNQALGPFFSERLADKEIKNVGVFGGPLRDVKNMMFLLFMLGHNKGVVDQAMYNMLINEDVVNCVSSHQEGHWAVNLGTTIEAIKAGKGDLGYMSVQYPHVFEKYKSDYMHVQPTIKEDGRVMNSSYVEYAIVHQWDRVPELAKMIRDKYNV